MKARNTFKSEERFPVYCKYPQQCNPQPAYITLNLRTGEVDADYSGEIGNGVPADVWHGLVIRFPLSSEATGGTIENMIDNNLSIFQEILDGSEVVWDGSNHVGKLTDEAREIAEDMDRNGFYSEEGGILTVRDIIKNGDFYPSDGQSIEDFAENIASCDGEEGYWLLEPVTVDDVLSELRNLWADRLYSGDELPKEVAQYLLETGECDDSQWMEELKEFAAQ